MAAVIRHVGVVQADSGAHIFTQAPMVPKGRYGACPKNETCAFSGRLTHHCTGAGGVGYEKILNWFPWKEPLPRRSCLTTP